MFRLAGRGWPARDMRVRRVSLPGGACHAVLLVRTGGGAVAVLDNRYASVQSVRAVERDGYRFDDCRSSS
jgi:predicted transglutaminase-like cysteine proteinase